MSLRPAGVRFSSPEDVIKATAARRVGLAVISTTSFVHSSRNNISFKSQVVHTHYLRWLLVVLRYKICPLR